MAPRRAQRRNGATPSRPSQQADNAAPPDGFPNVPIGSRWDAAVAAASSALPSIFQTREPDERKSARAVRREPTPDQVQLSQSLYFAADQHSEKTPSPPVPHSVSTDSSPGVQPPSQRKLSNSPIYPSPLHQTGSPNHSGRLASSPYRHSSVDNASVASWNLERDINNDNLQRTRPSQRQRGHNITAPPRRVSGLANIYEENEDMKSEYTPSVQDLNETRHNTWTQLFARAMEGSYRTWLRTAFYSFLVVGLLFMPLIAEKTRDYMYPKEFDWDSSANISIPKPEVFHSLRSHLSQMDLQMSSLSQELSSVRSEQSLSLIHDSTPTGITVHRKQVHKVNFLSVALGAIVDPANTSPTLGSKRSAPVRAFLWASSKVARNVLRAQQSPMSALTAWEEVGDCWCSAPRKGITQLAVHLGREIVPEEVVVEHIPIGASLEPEAAPRTIEVWARFKVNRHQTPVKAKLTPEAAPGRSGFFKVFGDATVSQTPLATDAPSSREAGLGGFIIPGIGNLHALVMEMLHRSNPFEPPSAYSDDPILGGNFYRVGKVEYDIHAPNWAQTFKLNTIVDVDSIRVDKVVFRVTENWGAKHTCIYRLKLHGHV